MKKLARLWIFAALAAPLALAGCSAQDTNVSAPAQTHSFAQVQPSRTPEPFVSKAAITTFVPDLEGLSAEEAAPVLAKMGFKVKWSQQMSDRSKWVIVDSHPAKGAEMPVGSQLNLTVEKASDYEAAQVPSDPGQVPPSQSASSTATLGSL